MEPLANTPWPAHQAALNALQEWGLMGRLAVTDERNGWHAGLYWVQRGPAYSIDLIGPLGQGRVHIRGDAQGVNVQTVDGHVFNATDPEQLLEEVVGVRIPVKNLAYWVRGLPDPMQQSALAGDAQGRLTQMEQGGWVIEYLNYARVAELDLPMRMRASQHQLKVQLVVNQWYLQPPFPIPG